MADYALNTYMIERNFNDFGPRATNIGFVGKTEVTILDNLYRISQLLHGRILSSSSVSGGFRVYIVKSQLKDLILAYQAIAPYKLSPDLDPLVLSLRSLFQSTTTDIEIGIDNRIIMQMINVHNTISTNLKNVWDGVISIRLLSYSGFNKDITIDGKQQILDSLLTKFSDSELQYYKPVLERSGQLGGVRSARQVEMRDMVADMIFSRKDSYVTLHQLFHTTALQRNVLRKFRTDILFCPMERYGELDSGIPVRTLVELNSTESGGTTTTIRPKGFEYAEFRLVNKALNENTVTLAGSIGSGKYILYPLQSIAVYGTALTIDTKKLTEIEIEVWSDIREFQGTGGSIVALALDGKLRANADMSNLFFQVIKPVMPYLSSLIRKIQTSDILKTTISKLPVWAQTIFKNVKPGHVYSGWLLTDPASLNDRILYIYMLTMMVPEFLLDPTFTFSDVNGTPPYIHGYTTFVQNLRRLYE